MAPRRKFDFKFKEKVLQFADKHSGEEAARHFNIDPKRVRDWRKQRAKLLLADQRRARLAGGGRKKVNWELERQLSEWIYSVWDQHHPVSGKLIRNKAMEIYPSVRDGDKVFVASRVWLQKFLQRSGLSLRRRFARTRTDLDLLTDRLVSFVDYVGKAVGSKKILQEDIIAMDETVIWFNSHLTVVLAAKADGTKLKPFIVFRGAAGEAKVLQQQTSRAVVASSMNGCMNDALISDWLQSVVGKSSPAPRLLVWDSYRCHINAATRAELKRGYNIRTAVIPAGGAKHIQAADVIWKQIFKQSLRDVYDQWTAMETEDRTAPACRLLVDWVVAAWDRLDQDLIRKSFKVCGLSVRSDGSEDELIVCFRKGQLCAGGGDALARLRQSRGCQAVQDDEDDDADEDELFNNELVVLDDDEEEEDDEDFLEEDGDHMSWHCFIHRGKL